MFSLDVIGMGVFKSGMLEEGVVTRRLSMCELFDASTDRSDSLAIPLLRIASPDLCCSGGKRYRGLCHAEGIKLVFSVEGILC